MIGSTSEPRGRIRLDDVRFRYPGESASLQVDRLDIAPRTATALVGASGIGKTTLLYLIAGILSPTRGSIEVSGRRLDRLGQRELRRFRREHVGLVFQELEMLEHLTARQNIHLPYLIGAPFEPAAEKSAMELAVDLGLEKVLDKRPRELSQGEKQRAAICRALAAHPDVILADEPTGNLDPARTDQVVDALRAAANRFEATLVVVTHDQQLRDRFDDVIDFESVASWTTSAHDRGAAT